MPVIPFNQPAGNFLLTVMKADDIIRISHADPRRFDPETLATMGGINRFISQCRVDEISEYAKTVDATFPTPILLALQDDYYELQSDNMLYIDEAKCRADIVDGQHRVRGLEKSGHAHEYSLPVVFILEPTREQKALMFATINGKQTKVPASLIYDLFGITETRSPQKTAHEIARALNSMPDSAWYRRLKMLGTKTPGSSETLSQGTFVKQLLPNISADPVDDMNRIRKGDHPIRQPDLIFNEYFYDNKDAIILKVLLNYFKAAKNTWPCQWDDPTSSILTKSVGFTGLMMALPRIYQAGHKKNSLKVEYFEGVFQSSRRLLEAQGRELTSKHFSASSSGAGNLRDLFCEAIASG